MMKKTGGRKSCWTVPLKRPYAQRFVWALVSLVKYSVNISTLSQKGPADVIVRQKIPIFKNFFKILKIIIETKKHDFLLNFQKNPALFHAQNRTNLSRKLPISQ